MWEGYSGEPPWLSCPEPLPLPAAERSGYAPVEDVSLYYRLWNPNGPDPVILLHGGLGSIEEWGGQVPALAPKHRVIALDSRGHGRSTASSRPFGYRLMASDVTAVMDHLGIERASIVGFSDGAIIGLDIAIRWPERLDRLFAFGANYSPDGLYHDLENHPVARESAAKAAKRFLEISPDPGAWDDLVEAVVAMWHREPNYSAVELGGIAARCLIATGEYEEAVRPEHTAALAALIPGAQSLTIPRVSHFAMFQDPEAFNRAMTGFLDAGG